MSMLPSITISPKDTEGWQHISTVLSSQAFTFSISVSESVMTDTPSIYSA